MLAAFLKRPVVPGHGGMFKNRAVDLTDAWVLLSDDWVASGPAYCGIPSSLHLEVLGASSFSGLLLRVDGAIWLPLGQDWRQERDCASTAPSLQPHDLILRPMFLSPVHLRLSVCRE